MNKSLILKANLLEHGINGSKEAKNCLMQSQTYGLWMII